MWALGCIFGELVMKVTTNKKKCILFNGTSCFPTSPVREYFKSDKKKNIIGADD